MIRQMIFLLASRSYYEVKLMAAEEFLWMIFTWKLSVSVRITEQEKVNALSLKIGSNSLDFRKKNNTSMILVVYRAFLPTAFL